MSGHQLCVKLLAFRMCPGSVKNKQGLLASKIALIMKKEQETKADKKQFQLCSKWAKKAAKLEAAQKVGLQFLLSAHIRNLNPRT